MKKATPFPLYRHNTGQWAKKVKNPKTGKFQCFYFGTDKDEALERWNKEKDSLFSNTKNRDGSGPTLAELGNLYIANLNQRNDAEGVPAKRHIDLCQRSIRSLIRIMGESACVGKWEPIDYEHLRLEMHKPTPRAKPKKGKLFGRQVSRLSAETVAGEVRRIRGFILWCYEKKYIGPPDWGKSFPVRKKERHTKESIRRLRRDLAAKDILAIIERASVSFRPIIWLGINSGLGNGDIAHMELADISDSEWCFLPRLKNGGEREFPIWPETREAINKYLLVRPKPKRGYENILFLTSHGQPWQRGEGHFDRVDSIGSGFTRIRKECGLTRGAFYDLRRTFATRASELGDDAAARFLMGHKAPKNDVFNSIYVQNMDRDRLRRLTDHVREWLLGGKS